MKKVDSNDVSIMGLNEKKKNNQMIGMLTSAVLKKDGIDDLFEKHFDSDCDENPMMYDLTEMAVKPDQINFDNLKHKSKEEQLEYEKIQRQRKRFLFRKKVALTDMKSTYHRM